MPLTVAPRRGSHPPGPPAHGLLGHQRAYAADPLGTFRRWSAEYGDAVRLRFGPVPVLLLTGPKATEDVLVHVADAFEKAPLIRRAARTVIGESVFAAEGEVWQRQRRLLEPLFTRERAAAAIPEVAQRVTAMTAGWARGDVIETLAATMALSQRLGGRVLFGSDVTDEDIADTAAALRAVEIGAAMLLKATKVDGVYSADPHKDPGAVRYDQLTYTEVLSKRLGALYSTAVSLCMDNEMPILVFDINREGNISRAALGEPVGTLIHGGTNA